MLLHGKCLAEFWGSSLEARPSTIRQYNWQIVQQMKYSRASHSSVLRHGRPGTEHAAVWAEHRRFAFLLYYCCKLKTWHTNKPFSQKPESPGSIWGNKVHVAIWDACLKDRDNRTIWFSHPWDALLTMSSGLFSGFERYWKDLYPQLRVSDFCTTELGSSRTVAWSLG